MHPFEVSFTRDDVRITTRSNRNYLPASLFGTAHETGHGLYEQGVSSAHTRTVFATDLIGLYAVGGTSFGAHESQSRLWENHVVRSRDFWRLHFPQLQASFPAQLGDVTGEDFYRAVTHIEPGLIRVEADELTYDLHVMLRVDIECALMDGSIEVADLPDVWNAAIQRDLGVTVPHDGQGVLQDIHWSSGYIGSFPSYTIGNVMTEQLMDTLRQEDAELDDAISQGRYTQLADQLRSRTWQHGRCYSRVELLVRATDARSMWRLTWLTWLTWAKNTLLRIPEPTGDRHRSPRSKSFTDLAQQGAPRHRPQQRKDRVCQPRAAAMVASRRSAFTATGRLTASNNARSLIESLYPVL